MLLMTQHQGAKDDPWEGAKGSLKEKVGTLRLATRAPREEGGPCGGQSYGGVWRTAVSVLRLMLVV